MHKIILKKPAKRFLKKLDKYEQKRIINKLKELKQNPQLGKPLIGKLSGLWSLRVGKYRALYQILENELIILILNIGHRKKIYDNIL
ncbi:MAG: type II toxin-antitoxin system RelE/ParE family toxin [Nanoarchaeota archaeon]|nr:type II toxin-antitoxin system RelE/ParE family toxin [Nanoarchaeota archaeon]MBU4116776.1 type II toxin-antitoxin system RelE/ParE family toxin [Nanoarchaeota archaeon]